MKKRIFLKRIAPILVVFCIFATVLPATTAMAASKITLKSGAAAPSTVYAGHSYTLKVSGTAVKFYSSNKKVATVGVSTGKLKALSPGTVKITAKSTKTGKAVAVKTFKVNQRATSITTNKSEIYLSKGSTETITAMKNPTTSTDVIRFYSDDKNVATVGATSGKVTAKNNGKATIKVYSKATKATANNSKYNKVATVTVYVGDYIESADSDNDYVFLKFKGNNVPDTKASDYSIVHKETKASFPVKSVSKQDGQVVLQLNTKLQDGKKYTVTYRGSSSADFTACDGKVKDVLITPLEVVPGKATPIRVQTMTAKGLAPINTYFLGELAGKGLEYRLESISSGGYVSGNKLYLSKEGDNARFKVTYHTYRYEGGKEVGVIEKTFIVIAKKNATEPEPEPITYEVKQLYYTYTGGTDDYVSVIFNEDLPQDLKLKATDFYAFKAPTIVRATDVVVSGNRMVITMPSSSLVNGTTYTLAWRNSPIFPNQPLGTFIVSKYVYYPPAPIPYKAELSCIAENKESVNGIRITLNKPLPSDHRTLETSDFTIQKKVSESEGVSSESTSSEVPAEQVKITNVSVGADRKTIDLTVDGKLEVGDTYTVSWKNSTVLDKEVIGDITIKKYTATVTSAIQNNGYTWVAAIFDEPAPDSFEAADFVVKNSSGEVIETASRQKMTKGVNIHILSDKLTDGTYLVFWKGQYLGEFTHQTLTVTNVSYENAIFFFGEHSSPVPENYIVISFKETLPDGFSPSSSKFTVEKSDGILIKLNNSVRVDRDNNRIGLLLSGGTLDDGTYTVTWSNTSGIIPGSKKFTVENGKGVSLTSLENHNESSVDDTVSE